MNKWRVDEAPERSRHFRLGIALAVAGPVIAAITIAAQHNPRHYVYQDLIASPVAGLVIGLAMLAVAAKLTIIHRVIRVIAVSLATVLAALVAYGGMVIAGLDGGYTDVVATSARFTLVADTQPRSFGIGRVTLYLRSRHGLLSRQGTDPVACFVFPDLDEPDYGGWIFDRASFTGDGTVTVWAKNGSGMAVTFDPDTLRPDIEVDRCANVPPELIDLYD